MTPREVARVAHEMNRRWCELNGDTSQPSWENAPEWQITSAVNGVLYHVENPNAHATASHDNWLREKIADGWVYGEAKDPVAKTHPCCVPFEALPATQRAKDWIFLAVVDAYKEVIVTD